jgi:transposase
MRQVHHAGEKAFLDYSGKKPTIIDPATGEVIEVELFVIMLGASNYTYAEATRTPRTADFVGSTVRGLEYYERVPLILVPDQLRSAVTGTDCAGHASVSRRRAAPPRRASCRRRPRPHPDADVWSSSLDAP